LTVLGTVAKEMGADWNDFDSKNLDKFPDLQRTVLACDSKTFDDPPSVRNCGVQLVILTSKLP
jgi:hypothetical protein